MKKRVFMVSYGGGHANIIRNIYLELSKDSNIEIIYLALTTAPNQLKGRSVKYITVRDAAKLLSDREDVKKLGILYGEPFHNSQIGVSLEDTIYYYGIGMHDLIQEYGKYIAEEKLERYGRKIFLPVDSMKEIVKSINPDVCVITASPRMEMATGIAADGLGIPVVRINDLPICEKLSHNCILCVMNEWAKAYAIEKAGVLEENIRVTGQPVFDEDEVEPEWLAEFNKEAAKYKRTVVFFTENGKNQKKELDSLYEIAEELKDVLFIVKIHPNQEVESFCDSPQKNVWIKKGLAKNYLHVADVVITTFSTTGMEAAMRKIPLIEIRFDEETYALDYAEMGIAQLARNKVELFNEIKALLDTSSKEYKSLMKRYKLFKKIPNASRNICAVIKEQL
ncbi:CDP-glycerol glycerophosphotransferase family protein [Gallibacter sp. Marseille-QA0791]|uniref:CDP-glycerol glycerophosphotransferase family protein n=1 Tax=Gallibacter sp. Marseille-QA0791 TaxID=3378781 RepID=UPI003D0F22FC